MTIRVRNGVLILRPDAKSWEISVLDLMVSNRGLLHGEALTPLSATGSENSAAALGGHAGTEAVALGALAFVRLIGAFHCSFPFVVSE